MQWSLVCAAACALQQPMLTQPASTRLHGRRIGSPFVMNLESDLLDIELALEGVEDQEAALAEGLDMAVLGTRQFVYDLIPRFELPSLPAEFQLAGPIAELREVLRLVLEQERIASAFLLAVVLLTAVAGGLLSGDKSRSRAEEGVLFDDLFRTSLTPEQERAYDRGAGEALLEGDALDSRDESRRRSPRAMGVSAGQWLELALCVLLDAAGDASLFYPASEGLDAIGFAYFSALTIEIFFDWPSLALFAFWEELLPFTDIVPTATVGWFLVIVLGLRPDTREGEAIFRGKVDRDTFAPGVRPPLADRRAYAPPEFWLRPENRPWEKDSR